MNRPEVIYEWRGDVANPELVGLHAEGFDEPPGDTDWNRVLERQSLGWVCARRNGALVGFVNVIWDGGAHAFLLDTVVASAARGQGIGTRLVRTAVDEARDCGCQWIHVDFEDALSDFYLGACGFTRTPAGLIKLGEAM